MRFFGGVSIGVKSAENKLLTRVDRRAQPAHPDPCCRSADAGLSAWVLARSGGCIREMARSRKWIRAPAGCWPSLKSVCLIGELGVPTGEGRGWITLFEIPVSEIEPAANQVVRRWRSPGGDSIRCWTRLALALEHGPSRRLEVPPGLALTVVPLIRAIEIIRAPGNGSSGILSACFPPAQAWPSERALRLRSFSA